jgi:hypothetical protein
VEDRLPSPEDWARTTDREFKIRGRHSRRYFHFADQLLRNEVELHRLTKLESGGNPAEGQRLQEQIAAARAGLQASRHEVEA